MRIRIALVLACVAALAVAAVAYAAPAPFKVTGGGQALVSADSNSVRGPGDTITFQAFIANNGLDEDATGHVNVIDRVEGATTKKGQGVHWRGEVDCAFLATDPVTGGGYAELYGSATNKQGNTTDFLLRIIDNGQGADNTDEIEFDTTPPEDCGENDDEEDPAFYLARGNAKIHKQNSGASQSSAKSTSTRSLSLTSLR